MATIHSNIHHRINVDGTLQNTTSLMYVLESEDENEYPSYHCAACANVMLTEDDGEVVKYADTNYFYRPICCARCGVRIPTAYAV